ncbi:MAG: SUMF1/EgtB/PvdO family nonheme iron enzyme [Planctomycetes bacterium]|nr:SUMF1/EgtB/PvdO family nonheme iron enzyme [Planctomycetota bacterium]
MEPERSVSGRGEKAAGGDPFSIARTVPESLVEGADTVVVRGEGAGRVRELLTSAGAGANRYRGPTLLGKGGMGAVYVAVDAVLGREVAIKVALAPEHSEILSRFLTEARVTAGLSHPGIVAVDDMGLDEEGRPWFAMKRIRGKPWSEVLEGETPRERLDVFQKVAEAISHAHANGVLHRDLKPANILVGSHGEVVVADWGLARVQGAADVLGGPGSRSMDTSHGHGHGHGHGPRSRSTVTPAEAHGLTRAGSAMGTPGCAAPEQMAGEIEKLGPATDIYALGAILHQCLAGEPPFRGSSFAAILAAQDVGPPPIARSASPAELAAISRKCLAREPADRYPSVAELLADIDRWRGGFPVSAYPEPLLRRALKYVKRHKVAATAALVLLAAGTALAVLDRIRTAASKAAEREEAALAFSDAGERTLDELASAEEAISRAEVAREVGDTSLCRAQLDVASAFFTSAEKAREQVLDDFPELAPIEERVTAGRRTILLVEAKRQLGNAARPLADPHAEARRRGNLWSDVLDAVRKAREAGVDDPALDAIENESRGLGTLRVTSDPPGATVEVYSLDPEKNANAPLPENLVTTLEPGSESLELAAGSYLLVLSHPDRAPCRLPVYLMRGETRNRVLVVPLLRPDEIPEGFVYIPPGPWLRGETCEFTEAKAGFLIAEAELTWGEFWDGYGESLPPDRRPQSVYSNGEVYDLQREIARLHPADWKEYALGGVSHDDLVAFCKWKSEGNSPFEYRLPTTAEWERAARGADGRTFPWGDEWGVSRCNNRELHESFALEAFHQAKGARYAEGRSTFGLWQTLGNVWEWTSSGEGHLRVYRGGSAADDRNRCRCWFSGARDSGLRNAAFGGRVVAVARTR